MLAVNSISAKHFDLFRLFFGAYCAMVTLLLLFDRSLSFVFGIGIHAAAIVCTVAALLFAFNYQRKIFAALYLLSLAYIVEINPSALRIIPGYIGWILFCSLFVSDKEGSFIRRKLADPDWKFEQHIYIPLVFSIAFSISFSGITKLLSNAWLQGRALEIFFNDIRFNQESNVYFNIYPAIGRIFNYLTVIIEICFCPLYFLSKTRQLSWYLIFALFIGTLVFMKVYVVSLGMIFVLLLLYPVRDVVILRFCRE